MFGFLFSIFGSMKIEINHLTGPKSSEYGEASRFAQQSPSYGKPISQDRGDELATRSLSFYFDQNFCDPESEISKLSNARKSRSVVRVDIGNRYDKHSYVIDKLKVTELETDDNGSPTRAEVTLDLIETKNKLSSLVGLALGAVGSASPFAKKG